MKNFELGDKVFVEKYYRPRGHVSFNKYYDDRYYLLDINKNGVYAGRRLIYTKGYTEHGFEDGNTFVPIEQEQVHLIAINHSQTVYVPDKYIKEV